jgi:hypothetical protein
MFDGLNGLTIDGSYGEGGGQILRTALALSIVLSKPIEIINIRKGRKKGGLQPQHLTCVNACGEISNAHIEGNEIGSSLLRFHPGKLKGGDFTFDVAEERGGRRFYLSCPPDPPAAFDPWERSCKIDCDGWYSCPLESAVSLSKGGIPSGHRDDGGIH